MASLTRTAALAWLIIYPLPVVNLVKGMLRRVADLQLHDVDGVGHEDDHVGADGS